MKKVLLLCMVFAITSSAADWQERLDEARRLMKKGAFTEAAVAYRDAARLAVIANRSPATLAAIRCELGWAMSEASEASDGLIEMVAALKTIRSSGDPVLTATCARNLAFHFRSSGRYEESKELFQEVIALERKDPGRQSTLGKTLVGLAGLELLRGNHAAALDGARRALLIQERSTEIPSADLAETFALLALVSRALQKPLDALMYSERELALRRRSTQEHSGAILSVLCTLAATNAELRRFSKADHWSKQAEAVLRLDPQSPTDQKAKVLVSLAYVAFQREDLRNAERLYEEALMLLQTEVNPGRLETATVWTHLGRTRRRMGDYAAALQCHRNALSSLKDAVPESHPFVAFGILALAEDFRLLERYEEAAAHYLSGLQMAEEFAGQGNPNLAADYENFAAVLRKINRDAEAKHYLSLARKAKASGDHRSLGFTVDVDELRRKQ
jgi:tetratricopeptide (TPR) repeat protein